MFEDVLARLSEASTLTATEIVSRLLLALILTTPIAAIYARNYRGYGRPSQMTLVLVLVSLATGGIIMAIGNNLALSLGMVGALSIVRFRAAVKDNRDLAYLFWSLSVGLVCGAGGYLLAIVLTVFLGGVALGLERLEPFRSATRRYIVILSLQPGDEPKSQGLLPGGAELKSTVFQREAGVEESTYLVDFADAGAIEAFKQRAREQAAVTGYQILGPEDTILG
jgi:hypothetical protein